MFQCQDFHINFMYQNSQICSSLESGTVSLIVKDFDVKASLSNKSEQKLRSLNWHVGLATRGLYSMCTLHAAEVIPYQEHWKGSLK